jgi:hypothetical protein
VGTQPAPGHRVWPEGQSQLPATHIAPPLHVLPHAPQLLLSVCVSTHLPLHEDWPEAQPLPLDPPAPVPPAPLVKGAPMHPDAGTATRAASRQIRAKRSFIDPSSFLPSYMDGEGGVSGR